jgi:hypothetical protein
MNLQAGAAVGTTAGLIDQLNVKGIIPLKAENDAPIGPYRHGPQPPPSRL